jgi:hypothetical protein
VSATFGPHFRIARPTALLAPVTTTFMTNPNHPTT